MHMKRFVRKLVPLNVSMTKLLIGFVMAEMLACAADPVSPSSEVATLRALLARQQQQIDELRQTLQEQSRLLESLAARDSQASRRRGEIASTAAILPPLPALTTIAIPLPTPQGAVAAPVDTVQKA